MYAQRRDANEPEIIRAYRDVGAYVQQMDKDDGFDLLVCFRGQAHIVEVKNPRKQQTREGLIKMLTENELEVMRAVEATGVRYNIVTNEAEAKAVIKWK